MLRIRDHKQKLVDLHNLTTSRGFDRGHKHCYDVLLLPAKGKRRKGTTRGTIP